MANLKNMLVIVLLLSFILISGCSETEPNNDEQEKNDFVSNNTNIDNMTAQPITNNVIAVVNGEEIESEEVFTIQHSMLQQGQQISEEEAIEQAINQKVLEQKVQQSNFVVTNEEAESVIEQQLMMQGATLDDYKQQLKSQGFSYDEELENIKSQIATQNYLQTQLEGQSFNVTEEEVRVFYDLYKNQSSEEVPSYEDLKSQIVTQLEQQKQRKATSVLIQELRASANVEYK